MTEDEALDRAIMWLIEMSEDEAAQVLKSLRQRLPALDKLERELL